MSRSSKPTAAYLSGKGEMPHHWSSVSPRGSGRPRRAHLCINAHKGRVVVCITRIPATCLAGTEVVMTRCMLAPATGTKPIQAMRRMGHGPGEFQCPIGVAVDGAAAFLYVTDDQNFRVQKLSIVTPAPGACCLDLVGWFGGCDQADQHQGNDRMHAPDTTHHPQRGPGDGFFRAAPPCRNAAWECVRDRRLRLAR